MRGHIMTGQIFYPSHISNEISDLKQIMKCESISDDNFVLETDWSYLCRYQPLSEPFVD